MTTATAGRGQPEVRGSNGWRRLAPDLPPPAIGESALFTIRGIPRGSVVRVGDVERVAGADGSASVEFRSCPTLAGHIGLMAVELDGRTIGEVEVVPDKMSEDAYVTLRDDLRRVWLDLVFDPDAVSSIRARLPSAHELWDKIRTPVHEIARDPRELLDAGVAARRLEHVRRATELSPAVLRGAARGAPGLTRVVGRTAVTPENRMVGDTLHRLRRLARREDDGAVVARQISSVLAAEPRLDQQGHAPSITWGMRSDPRYRQILRVNRLLQRPETNRVEGPGELRLGVRSLPRLYEYWVFLQVLLSARERYGDPGRGAFESLVGTTGPDRSVIRLELVAGTTVEFPGRVFVAFEPRITARGDGWRGLEYVPHPSPDRQQIVATPDVVVLCEGPRPEALVIDAKYVGRHWVDAEAENVHAKYARMRRNGSPVVRRVVAVHPHVGKELDWAGYGAIAMVPGGPRGELELPPSSQ